MTSQTPGQPQNKISQAERDRLLKKDAINTATEIANAYAMKLHAWYTICLNVERDQVAGDRVGAMHAIAQRPPMAPVPVARNTTTTSFQSVQPVAQTKKPVANIPQIVVSAAPVETTMSANLETAIDPFDELI
jgi:hypothetical protein